MARLGTRRILPRVTSSTVRAGLAGLALAASVPLAFAVAQQPADPLAPLVTEAQDDLAALLQQRDALQGFPADVERDLTEMQGLVGALQKAVADGDESQARTRYRAFLRKSERVGRFLARRYAPQTIEGGTRAELETTVARINEHVAMLRAAALQAGIRVQPGVLTAVDAAASNAARAKDDASLAASVVALRNAAEVLQDAVNAAADSQPISL